MSSQFWCYQVSFIDDVHPPADDLMPHIPDLAIWSLLLRIRTCQGGKLKTCEVSSNDSANICMCRKHLIRQSIPKKNPSGEILSDEERRLDDRKTDIAQR